MKELLLILVLSLLFTGSVSAEKVTLNCKFESGKETDTRYQTEKINKKLNETIILDIEAKRIIEAPFINSYVDNQYRWQSDDRHGSLDWEDTNISWDYYQLIPNTNKFSTAFTGTINRVSGQLYTYEIFNIPNSSESIITELYYQCSIKKRMF